MITIIHGNNLALSRKQYADMKQSAQNPVVFDGAKVTLSQLTQALEGQELFAPETQVFIEEFLSKRRASKETEQLTDYLTAQSKHNTIVVWESKELSPKQINSLGKPEVKKFDIPKEVFAFLDSLQPKNNTQIIKLFHRVLASEEPEFVFFMIVRQFRMMLGLISEDMQNGKGWHGGKASDGAQPRLNRGSTDGREPVTGPLQGIDEIKRLAPWQKSKLIKQADVFGKDALLENYFKLFDIEQGLKTGQLGKTLQQEIDFFLSTL